MNKVFILLGVVALFVIYKFYVYDKRYKKLRLDLEDVQEDNKQLNQKNHELSTRILSVKADKKTSDDFLKHHTLMVNSDQNKVTIDLPHRLRNVQHVELISGIVPKSQYRVNIHNNTFSIGNNAYTVQTGGYTDIISLLMKINQDIYDRGDQVILMYNSLDRNVFISANTSTTSITFDTMGPLLGFENAEYVFSGPALDANVVTSSLQYFLSLRTNSVSASKAINNLPGAYYTFVDSFVTGTTIFVDPTLQYVVGENRVNMKHQLYMDVTIDEVQYWDGSHRLARIYIPEDKEETEYESYGRPILRSLINDHMTLDKLTINLKSVLSETEVYDYDLNGLNYSLQIQITTVDKLLLRQ